MSCLTKLTLVLISTHLDRMGQVSLYCLNSVKVQMNPIFSFRSRFHQKMCNRLINSQGRGHSELLIFSYFSFQFIQVSDESPPENIFTLMTKIWKVEKPQILISVTGGAKSFNLDPKLKDMFANGLRKVLLFFLFSFC